MTLTPLAFPSLNVTEQTLWMSPNRFEGRSATRMSTDGLTPSNRTVRTNTRRLLPRTSNPARVVKLNPIAASSPKKHWLARRQPGENVVAKKPKNNAGPITIQDSLSRCHRGSRRRFVGSAGDSAITFAALESVSPTSASPDHHIVRSNATCARRTPRPMPWEPCGCSSVAIHRQPVDPHPRSCLSDQCSLRVAGFGGWLIESHLKHRGRQSRNSSNTENFATWQRPRPTTIGRCSDVSPSSSPRPTPKAQHRPTSNDSCDARPPQRTPAT